MKRRSFFKRTLGLFTASAVIISGLVSVPTVVHATEPETTYNPPTKVTLNVETINPTTVELKATLDKPLEGSSSVLSLYKVGEALTQQTSRGNGNG